jgi:hypothetical protein
MHYLPLILIACACDAGSRHKTQLCVPQDDGPSGYVTHSDRGQVTAGGAYLLDQLKARSATQSDAVDVQLWRLVQAYCRPCSISGEARPINEMFPSAHIPEAVSAGCFSLTLGDGSLVYGDLRSKLGMSMPSSRSQ